MTTHLKTATERGTIYTLGASCPDAAAHLDRLMRNSQACLVDIRSHPRSPQAPQWSRGALSGRYRRRYVWERRLGTLSSQQLERGTRLAEGHGEAIREAAALLCEGTSLILLCECSDARTCHRSLVAKLIQDALPIPKHGEVRA